MHAAGSILLSKQCGSNLLTGSSNSSIFSTNIISAFTFQTKESVQHFSHRRMSLFPIASLRNNKSPGQKQLSSSLQPLDLTTSSSVSRMVQSLPSLCREENFINGILPPRLNHFNSAIDAVMPSFGVSTRAFGIEAVAARMVSWMIGGAGLAWSYLVAREEWRKRSFTRRINLSLNTFGENGQLRIRTLWEKDITDVFMGNKRAVNIVMEAAKKTTAENPILILPESDSWFIYTTILNEISALFAMGHLYRDMMIQPKRRSVSVPGVISLAPDSQASTTRVVTENDIERLYVEQDLKGLNVKNEECPIFGTWEPLQVTKVHQADPGTTTADSDSSAILKPESPSTRRDDKEVISAVSVSKLLNEPSISPSSSASSSSSTSSSEDAVETIFPLGSANPLANSTLLPYISERYVFCLTREVASEVRFEKIRIMMIKESTLRSWSKWVGVRSAFELKYVLCNEEKHQRGRWAALTKMAELYHEQTDRERKNGGTLSVNMLHYWMRIDVAIPRH